MPHLGGLLKKHRTKDSLEDPTASSSTADASQSSTGAATGSSHTSFEPAKPEGQDPHAIVPTSAPKDAPVVVPQPTTSTSHTDEATAAETEKMSAHHAHASGTTATSAARVTKGKYLLTDFQLQRTLGTGSFGRVHLVQSKHNQRFYAVKVLKKAQVVKMKQVEHTNDERKMLAKVKHPFLITLWGTFQDSKNLYMVMDFVEGGELFSLLRKSQVSREGTAVGVRG
jgi:protein kinase A